MGWRGCSPLRGVLPSLVWLSAIGSAGPGLRGSLLSFPIPLTVISCQRIWVDRSTLHLFPCVSQAPSTASLRSIFGAVSIGLCDPWLLVATEGYRGPLSQRREGPIGPSAERLTGVADAWYKTTVARAGCGRCLISRQGRVEVVVEEHGSCFY